MYSASYRKDQTKNSSLNLQQKARLHEAKSSNCPWWLSDTLELE
jgi:hypothetical protein